MRVVLATTAPFGGAGGATLRLLRSLRAAGTDAHLVHERPPRPAELADLGPAERAALVQVRPGPLDALARELLERRAVRRHARRRTSHFDPGRAGRRAGRRIAALAPDVVNLHWIGGGFLSIEAVARLGRPVVWTLHDAWTLTGGCHYPGGCERYRDTCGACPVLGSEREDDLSRRVLERKRRAWAGLRSTVVAPSRWLAAAARASRLFREARVEVVPYGIDLETFRPLGGSIRTDVRREHGLDGEDPLVLFGAWDDTPRKGLGVLREALALLAREGVRFQAAGFGTGSRGAEELGGRLRLLGRIDDPRTLARLYAAADVFALPSLEDNLPTTVLEAMASGTPCVGFGTGGVPDMIRDGETGLVAEVPGDPAALARAIGRVLGDRALRERLARSAREVAERDYSCALEARRYRSLFEETRGET